MTVSETEGKAAGASQAGGLWRAGLARVDITPPLGVWLCGFGSRKRPADGIHDPLYATAAVFERSGRKVAIVSCDVLSIDAVDVERVRQEIAAATGIEPGHILVHATHTHAGPLTSSMRGFGPRDEAYESVFFRQIVTAVRLADARLRPVRLTFGTAPAPIGVNRREWQGGRVIIGERPEGPYDPRAAVLGIWPAEGGSSAPLGIILWAAVHPVLFGSDNYLFGRDFPHFALERLEQAYPGLIPLYLTGPCGDINPIGMRSPDRWAMARRHGEVLAGAALLALATGRPVAPGPIGAVQHVFDLPCEPLPSAESVRASLAAWEAETASGAGAGAAAGGGASAPVDERVRRTTDHRLHWADAALAALAGRDPAEPLPITLRPELQLVAIGDVAWTAMPFEVFVEYQRAVDEASAGYESLIVGYANGNFGYLPTREAFDEGGYEVERAWWYYTLSPFTTEAPRAALEALAALHAKARRELYAGSTR